VAAPAYLERHGLPVAPKDLETHECIRIRFPSGAILPWQFEKRGKVLEVAVTGHLILNHEELALRAALDGVGILYLAPGYAEPHVKAGRLVPMLESWSGPSRQIFLYYPSRRQVPLPLQVFIEFLRQNLQVRTSNK